MQYLGQRRGSMDLFWTIYLDIDRVLHILSGIMWIGLLYYLNFVQVPAFARMEAAARTNAIVNLVPRVLLFFRFAALFTVLFGIGYIAGMPFTTDRYFDTPRFYNVAIGGALGIIMFLNVWVIIWPNQKKIIAAAREGRAPDPSWGRKAL